VQVAIPCPRCGAAPEIMQDSVGLSASAWVIWCAHCEAAAKAASQRIFMARALSVDRVIKLWNEQKLS
jgi:hypothetical protein